MNAQRCARGSDRGASAVEFALVLLPLLFILFGIIDYGRLFYVQVNLESATREIARQWAVNGEATAINDAKASIEGLASLSNVTGAAPGTVTWTSTPATCTTLGESLTTTVTIPFSMALPLLPAPSELHASTTMRCEQL